VTSDARANLMRLNPSRASRFASVGLAVVLLALAGFAIWNAARTSSSIEAADDASLLSQAYQDARTFVRAEDFWATEYLLQLGPEADYLDPAVLRREHARAAASLEGALTTIARLGGDLDRALVPGLRARHARSLRATHALFDAVDAHEPRRALAIELHQVDQLFPPLEARVEREAAEHRATAERLLLATDRRSQTALVVVPIVFVVGLALVGVFWGVQRASARRVEAVRRADLERVEVQNQRLRELDRLKDEFVASVSHELRTPLTSIRGYLELVRDGEAGPLTDEQQEFLRVVDRNADRLLRVVSDLLFVAQVDAGKLTVELEPLDLAELARETADIARPAAEAKGVELRLETGPVPPLDGDRARLGQLLDNLVSNAVKFTPRGGRVVVRTAGLDDGALLAVEDTGIGVAPADRDRLFERFYRTRAATEQAIQGTGLGLSIARAIVDAHGGTIGVESESGRGSTFRVVLPLAQARPAEQLPAAA
jgi:signal transduction histidine kinase